MKLVRLSVEESIVPREVFPGLSKYRPALWSPEGILIRGLERGLGGTETSLAGKGKRAGNDLNPGCSSSCI